MANLATRRPKPGDVVERVYHVESELASDASGLILGAVVRATGKRYALRFWLDQDAAATAAATQHLVRYANSVSLFDEPGIVEVFGVGQSDGLFYSVTDWLEGTTLKRRMERKRAMSAKDALALLLPCLEGLAAAHAAGVVHGDLRPSNVFVCQATRFDPERARLMKFEHGTWPDKPLDFPRRMSDDIAVRQFVSPEEQQGRRVDARSDVYAAGVLLYTLLAGRSPFSASHVRELAIEIVAGAWTPLSQRVAGISPGLEQVIARALAKDPQQRFQNMSELLAQLARVEGHVSAALAKHVPIQKYTWIRPASDYVHPSLFDLPAVTQAELATRRRRAHGQRFLQACAGMSLGLMMAALVSQAYEPPARASRAASKRAAAESGLSAATRLPSPEQALLPVNVSALDEHTLAALLASSPTQASTAAVPRAPVAAAPEAEALAASAASAASPRTAAAASPQPMAAPVFVPSMAATAPSVPAVAPVAVAPAPSAAGLKPMAATPPSAAEGTFPNPLTPPSAPARLPRGGALDQMRLE
jgi:eukaryotic-like serine/threonine-protein kinase